MDRPCPDHIYTSNQSPVTASRPSEMGAHNFRMRNSRNLSNISNEHPVSPGSLRREERDSREIRASTNLPDEIAGSRPAAAALFGGQDPDLSRFFNEIESILSNSSQNVQETTEAGYDPVLPSEFISSEQVNSVSHPLPILQTIVNSNGKVGRSSAFERISNNLLDDAQGEVGFSAPPFDVTDYNSYSIGGLRGDAGHMPSSVNELARGNVQISSNHQSDTGTFDTAASDIPAELASPFIHPDIPVFPAHDEMNELDKTLSANLDTRNVLIPVSTLHMQKSPYPDGTHVGIPWFFRGDHELVHSSMKTNSHDAVPKPHERDISPHNPAGSNNVVLVKLPTYSSDYFHILTEILGIDDVTKNQNVDAIKAEDSGIVTTQNSQVLLHSNQRGPASKRKQLRIGPGVKKPIRYKKKKIDKIIMNRKDATVRRKMKDEQYLYDLVVKAINLKAEHDNAADSQFSHYHEAGRSMELAEISSRTTNILIDNAASVAEHSKQSKVVDAEIDDLEAYIKTVNLK